MWELFGLVVAMALSISWMVRIAESRGRNQVFWGLVAALICVLGFVASVFLIDLMLTNNDRDDVSALVAMFVPFPVTIMAVFGLGVALGRLPVKVVASRRWKVHCRKNGAGWLEISPEVLRLEWEDRKQDISRSLLHKVEADGECLRLGWTDDELLLIPMMQPQTRDGRIRQSQTLARLLSPGLPTAIRVDRKRPKATG